MPTKRRILEEITRERLLEFARLADVPGLTGKSKAEIVDELASAKRARLGEFLPTLSRDELKAICTGVGLDDNGREKQVLVDRILGREEANAGLFADDIPSPAPQPVVEPREGVLFPSLPLHKEKLEIPAEPIRHLEPVEDYRHEQAKRKNIPPAKIAAEGTVPVMGKIEYSYSPRRPPVLRFDADGKPDKLPALLAAARKRPLTDDEVQLLADALRTQEPWLEWAGKRESEAAGFTVDPVALHIHERISAQAIVKVAARNDVVKSLFGDPELDYHEAVQFYRHDIDWTNRLILGDSLQVMASLAKREDLAGKVQMIYIDPPYGIRYPSNFQPEISRRDVKEKDTDLTREPEMVKAYRDTWHIGIHSYLSYLRDRLFVARNLLAPSGSVFVQISDENLHRVRSVLDDAFGPQNFVAEIVFQKTGGFGQTLIPSIADHLLWYCREKQRIKARPLHVVSTEPDKDDPNYVLIELPNGATRRMKPEERRKELELPNGAKVFRYGPLTSDGASTTNQLFTYTGIKCGPPTNSHWKTNAFGLSRLDRAERLIWSGNKLAHKLFWDYYPAERLGNIWLDTQSGGFNDPKVYVVQTTNKVVERCILLTTDPGDLVLDPTCGSGTTAYVAEQWGRRWITIDTSRVAVAIARQRLLTAKFDYYKLRSERTGPASGFFYKTVPHITLKSIAQNQNLDPIFARHEPILDAALAAANMVVGKLPADARWKAVAKLAAKAAEEGLRALTDADSRRWLLPGATAEQVGEALRSAFAGGRKKITAKQIAALTEQIPVRAQVGASSVPASGIGWEHWQVPFDTDADWPAELQQAVSAYRKAWRAKMDEVNQCIAENAEHEELVDQPEVVRNVVRVSGPFTVEAVQPPEMSLTEASIVTPIGGAPDEMEAFPALAVREVERKPEYEVKNLDAYLDQMVKYLRLDGVRFPDNKQTRFTRLERIAGYDGIHAEGRWIIEGGADPEPDGRATVGAGFGPQYGPVTAKQVEELIRAANRRGYDDLVVAGFSFDGAAQAVIDEARHPKLRIHRANIRPDINPGMNGLLKQQAGSQLFTVFGQPRTRVEKRGDEYVVTMEGVDIYDPVTNTIRPTQGEKVAAWFIDGDYDGRTFCITQAFFPDKSAWEKLAKALGGVVDAERFEALSGTVSLPFPAGNNRCVAVKVIDPRGNEVMQVHRMG